MKITIDKSFSPQFEVVNAEEPSASIKEYCYPGAIEGGFVDGVSVEIFPQTGERWFASFAAGSVSPNAANAVVGMPDQINLLVVSLGEAYVVNSGNPSIWEHLKIRPVMGVTTVHEKGLILVWDFTRVVAYNSEGLAWKTPSISWDGLSLESIAGMEAIFKIWDAPSESHSVATIALDSGTVTGGSSPELLGTEK